MDELRLRDPGHNPRVMNYCWKDLLQKKVNFVLQVPTNQCTFLEKSILLEKGCGMTFLPTSLSKETLFKPTSPNWS